MAVKNGCTVIPVSNVGTEDMVDIVADLPISYLPIPFLWGSDRTLPLVMPSGIRSFQRIYFLFGKPIETSSMRGYTTDENVSKVRDATERAVREGIERLKELRKSDPSRYAVDRISHAASKRASALLEWMRRINIGRDASRSPPPSHRK